MSGMVVKGKYFTKTLYPFRVCINYYRRFNMCLFLEYSSPVSLPFLLVHFTILFLKLDDPNKKYTKCYHCNLLSEAGIKILKFGLGHYL